MTVVALDALEIKSVEPLYDAVMLCVPTLNVLVVSVLVEIVTAPAVRGPVPSSVPPS